MGVDWTQFLVFGVPAYIAALGGAVAAILASLNRRNLKTSNGASIATTVEQTHALVAATADALGTVNEPPQEA